MSGQLLLDFSALATSLFITLVLLWLGLTVLFNAERRSWGVWLAVGGLITGAVFFLSHSVILSLGASALIESFSFWWHVGWAPVVAAPYIWYLLMLWYSGFWDEPGGLQAGRPHSLTRRQRPWLWFSLVYTLLLAGLLLLANPLPSISRQADFQVQRLPALVGVPLILLAYPPYILMCIGLALDALLRPAPSGRVMGDLARRRARPWFISASLLLLLVSLLLGGIILWLIQVAWQQPVIADLVTARSTQLSLLDLLLAALLMAAILLLGQALITYEIFTGKTLPRRGLLKQWRFTILFSAALSLLAAWGITATIAPVYPFVAVLLLVVFSYALFSWQSYVEREGSIRQLRPLAASPRLLESILKPSQNGQPQVDLTGQFAGLCREVLGARIAALVPLGSLAGLGSSPLHFPTEDTVPLPPLAGLLPQLNNPQSLGLPLDPGACGGFLWAAPLWSHKGLIGLLLLGEKSDGGFYSLEEIEIARSGGERLADTLASAEIGRRLLTLQRQRLAESGVLDRRARRLLHDEILPRLHAALLDLSAQLGGSSLEGQEALNLLADTHRQISSLLRETPAGSPPEVARLGLVGALKQITGEDYRNSFDEVIWQVDPEAERRGRELPALAAEVVYYASREALRNAARHARPETDERPLQLKARVDWKQGLVILVEDNGVGLPPPGPSSSDSGQGLALHSAMMAVIDGSLAVESAPGEFTRITLSLPDTAWSHD